ncbi:nitrate reductase cytochrome c-type subunit [Campylobacter sp. MIT 21-1685]|uniref:nitrate reductase cytochrome c-type subunit n=1 Tax=unclassified Campylobacter TaxID=2593542 RepID=UPI00224B445F|nr:MULTISPECIES: nitrate reductase cytochrome c-type subunit [unclassified Campylobacter]MCX2682992.1 nitrate reductase cytochrome c-type subunit [Campylobacter sp. MIT 21-1684]MCX2751274.1 nitrate reductase cytochrome c-type subunit [Campylobacter sp. MIT 21-1682]MCX2807473.1 nitrate reductase cytochrome c-type subunit [Campylobacter sp. MIT 21-1685]
MKQKIFLLLAMSALFLVSCAINNGLSSEQIGIRKTDLETENKVILPKVNYTNAQPGESVVYERGYENAPPLIPHDINDMIPITKDNNTCISCHDKFIAADVGATPIPATHYYNYRLNKSTGDSLTEARFNCTQCHVPQSDAKPLIGNTFKPEFKSENSKSRSNLIDVMNEGLK